MSRLIREIERAMRIRQELLHEIQHGPVSRRDASLKILFGGGALAVLAQLRSTRAFADNGPGGGSNGLLSSDSTSQIGFAPPTTPFKENMVHINTTDPHQTGFGWVKQPETLVPPPTLNAQTTAGGVAECRRDPHQDWATQWANLSPSQRKTYTLREQVITNASFHSELPVQLCWGFDSRLPGPTFHSKYGEPCMVRIYNELPDISKHVGYGCPETTTHLHNGHTASESDGYPDFYFPRQAELNPADIDHGRFRDHHYLHIYAGADPREALSTLWYHDHRHDFTAPNVYRGLAGFHLMFNEVDSNDEGSTDSRALKLPSGEYDVPLMVTDRFFDNNGIIQFDQFNFDGIIGNKYVVNGKIQPRFAVEPRKYRLRILNPGVSRTYGWSIMLSDSDKGLLNPVPLPGVLIIGTGGNLLPSPIPMRNPTPLGVSQRLDVIVDFAQVPKGKKYVYLVNQFNQTNGRMPDGFRSTGPNGVMFDLLVPGDPVLRFDVVLNRKGDSPPIPAKLRAMPWENDPVAATIAQLTERQILDAVGRSQPFPGVETVRSWSFDRTNGMWSVNGKIFDGTVASAQVKEGTGEIWILNGGGDWVHPIHLHFEEHRTLYRNGVKPQAGDLEFGRDDTMLIGPNERGILYRKFRDCHGKYVMHCHNVVHEDHAMMVRWDILP